MRAKGRGVLSKLVNPGRSPWPWGVIVAALLVTVETVLNVLLRNAMSPFSPGIFYVAGVLIVSAAWGQHLGMATALMSTLAFAVFHNPPFGGMTAANLHIVAGLAIFVVVALATGALADLSRQRMAEVQDSALNVELTQLLLHSDDPPAVLPLASQRIAQALQLGETQLHLAVVPADSRHSAIALRTSSGPPGTLLIPRDSPSSTTRRLRELIAPTLASALDAGYERAAVLQASRHHLQRLAAEQAALGRVAKLVARGGRAPEIFDAITTELHGLFAECSAWLLRYEADGTVSVVSSTYDGLQADQMRWPMVGESVPGLVSDTGRPARMDSFQHATGPAAALARRFGVRSAVGLPIVVEGRLWGLASVASDRPEPLPADTEDRMAAFVTLAATAVAIADNQDELAASRARLVAAADQARERLERKLHDGALQHLLTVAMQLGAAAANLPSREQQTRAELSCALQGLDHAVGELRDTCQDLHPTLLAACGLQAALKALARRSPVVVDLDLRVGPRMPAAVETAAYHIVAEAVTGAARRNDTAMLNVRAATREGVLHLSVRIDGVAQGDLEADAGLHALRDRVEALGGEFTMTSLAGDSTQLLVNIPPALAAAACADA